MRIALCAIRRIPTNGRYVFSLDCAKNDGEWSKIQQSLWGDDDHE